MKRLFLPVSFILFLSTPVFAADLYVSVDGTGAGCSKAEPCSSIQYAIDLSAEGDTIHVGEGAYVENIHIGTPLAPDSKPGITIKGHDGDTVIISAGTNTQRPAGVPADIVIDIWSRDVTISGLTILHPSEVPSARDIGIFVGPPAANAVISRCRIKRRRLGTGSELEPTLPGSRGVMVFRARGSVIKRNRISGNYQDHIHMPTSDAVITRNRLKKATRLGIVIIQESATSDNSGNIITRNTVDYSGTDGIQIQGDNNLVSRNKVRASGAAAIKLCGESDGDDTVGDGDCVAPFDKWAVASGNVITKNKLKHNRINQVVDNGSGNQVH